jgi:hypothetical protein
MTVITDAPNNDVNHLVNNVLLSSGVRASNFSFEGHPKQIGYDVNLYIPNSFTPNEDYDNEMLVYRADNIVDFDFSILTDGEN